MNLSMIAYIQGHILKTEGLLMLLPCIVSLFYREKQGLVYLGVGCACILLGYAITLRKPHNQVFYLKEGCVATALSWILLSTFGCLPFIITGEIPNFINSLFETVSGFTTTGASILSGEAIESMCHASLFWRSFTHWIGGMGVLVFILAIIPMSGGSPINLMRAESPGPSVGKLVPKIKQTARILYLIYFSLTVIEIVLLLIGKMPLFDSITLSFGTAGTGGFGVKGDSIASYSYYHKWVITIFMIMFGINFNAYYFIVFRKFKKAFSMEEVRYYLAIIVGAIALIFIHLLQTSMSAFEALTHASFQVASIITTTGYSTIDFDQWMMSCKFILLLLMFIGACAGSTGGGIKVSRICILFRTIKKELRSYIHPKSIARVNFEGKPVERPILRSTNVYFITFTIIFCISVFLISFEDYDLQTTITAVAATINNIGPGLGKVGPSANFDFFNWFSKIILIFDMLAGRLELFPLLILFHPGLWKDTFAKRLKSKHMS